MCRNLIDNTPKSWSKGMVDRGTVTRLLHDMFITKHKQCRSSSTHIAAAATTKLWVSKLGGE